MIDIPLDLSRHCIETEIKKCHNRAVTDYFRAGRERARLEQIVDITQHALQSMDFDRLRSVYTPLAGRSAARVVLSRHGDRLMLRMDGQEIEIMEKC